VYILKIDEIRKLNRIENNMKERILLVLCLFLFAIGQAQVSKTVNVTTPGTLSTLLTATELTSITDLTITGTIDARDFFILRDNMTALKKIDISAVTISAFTDGINYQANAIPENAFSSDTRITSIILPNNINAIQLRAFSGCSGLTGTLVIPSSVTYIGMQAFEHCSGLTGTLSIPSSVVTIDDWAFLACTGFTGSLNIPSSVNYIGYQSFSYCTGLTGTLTIPTSVTTIGNYAFYNSTGLTGSLIIPSSVTSIYNGAFMNCRGFTGSLIIPSSLDGISQEMFSGCSGLNGSLTIPASITFIGTNTFKNCSGLTSINVYASKPNNISLMTTVFSGVSTSTCVLHVPVGSKSLYAAASQWKDFINIVDDLVKLPALTTQDATNITPTTATGKGNFTDLGAPNATQYGVVWSTSSNPTVDMLTKTEQGTPTAITSFTSSITGLSPNTTYYVRAYATNSQGTSYGEEVTFKTINPLISAPSSASLSGFTTIFGTPSTLQTFTISGSQLFANLVITASPGFEIREYGNVTFRSSVSFTPVSRVVSTKTIEVRIASSTQSGDISGNIVCSSTWAQNQNVTVNGSVIPKQLSISPPTVVTSKTFDGNTGTDITLGTLEGVETADVNNVTATATANYDNTNAGTNKTITVIYTLSGSAKDNYIAPINYIVNSGVITAKKLTISNPTVVTNKTFDGNTGADITLGTLQGVETADVDNVSVTAISNYNNANAGTNKTITVVYTLSGSAKGNYIAPTSYIINTGGIAPKQLTTSAVPTFMINKTFDGITGIIISKPATLQGVIASDVNNVSVTASANYDNANAGTNKTITVVYTLSGTAKGNYITPVSYIVNSGEITPKQLTISTPTVILNKMIDGNTGAIISKLGTLQGVILSDLNNVSVTATANYDNTNAGTNKTITAIYTLNGTAKDNYIAPVNYVISNSKISDNITLSPFDIPIIISENSNVNLPYTLLTGTPTHYAVTFNADALNAGIQNISYTVLPTIDSNGILSVPIPTGTSEGTYQGTLQMKNELDVESPGYLFSFIISSLSDINEVHLSNVEVTAFPNPVRATTPCTLFVKGLNTEQLKNTKLSVYDMRGMCVYESTIVENSNKLNLPVSGVYVGQVTSAGNNYQFKIIVIK